MKKLLGAMLTLHILVGFIGATMLVFLVRDDLRLASLGMAVLVLANAICAVLVYRWITE